MFKEILIKCEVTLENYLVVMTRYTLPFPLLSFI